MTEQTQTTPASTRRSVILEPADNTGYPDAIVAEGLVFTSGARAPRAGVGFEALPPEGTVKQQGYTLVDHSEGLVSASAWGAHQRLEDILAAAGSDNSQILRQHVWQKSKRFFPCYEQVRKVWQPTPSPSSGLGVAAIPGTGEHWIGLDAIAVIPGAHATFTAREVVAAVDHSDQPSASHYSQAVRSGPLVFTAGHIPIKTNEPGKPLVRSFEDVPEEGRKLATGRSHPDSRDGPIAAQTWHCYAQLRELLGRAGLTFDDVILSTVYLADLKDFAVFHRVHRDMFGDHEPALAVSGFDEVGHRGCLIEIELTALDPQFGLSTRRIGWRGAAPFAAPAALVAGSFVFLSGMLGHDTDGRLVSSHADLPTAAQDAVRAVEAHERQPGLAAQTYAAFARLAEAMEDAGGTLPDLVKICVYLATEEDIAVFEAVRAMFIQQADLPAAEFVVVHGPGPLASALVQIEAIGVV